MQKSAVPRPAPGDELAPVFLLGAPRSGTSLLYKALCLHPRAAWISNWVRRAPAVPQLSLLNRLPRRLARAQRAVWFGGPGSNAYVYNSPRSALRRAFPMPVEGEPVFAHCGVGEGPAEAATSAQVACLRRTLGAVSRWGGGEVLVSKRISHNLRIGLLAQAFPRARFVSLVRDGRAVANSLARVDWWEQNRVWWYGGTPQQWSQEGRDPWELCARTWVEEVELIERGLGALPPASVHRLSYEEFVADAVPSLVRIAAFAGLGASADWEGRLATLRFPDMNQGWRGQLDDSVVGRIEALQAVQLRRYGYV